MTMKPNTGEAPSARKAVNGEAETIKVKAKPGTKAKAKSDDAPKKSKPEMPAKPTAGRRRVVFSVEAEPGSEVYVAGSFNGWNPGKHPMPDKSGTGRYERQVYAEPGALEYKFVVNGEWVIDARCSSWVPNALGSLNSVIEVR